MVGVRAAGDSGGSSVGEEVGRESIVLVGLSFLFVSEIGNIVGLTSVKDRLVREDRNEGHIDSGVNVEGHLGLTVLFNASEELASYEIVAAAVTCLLDEILVGIVPARVDEIVLLHTLGLGPSVVAKHYLAAHAAEVLDLTLCSADTVSIVMRSERGTAGYLVV